MVASILTNSHPSLVGLSVRNYETDGHDLSPQNSAKETATQAFLDSQKKNTIYTKHFKQQGTRRLLLLH